MVRFRLLMTQFLINGWIAYLSVGLVFAWFSLEMLATKTRVPIRVGFLMVLMLWLPLVVDTNMKRLSIVLNRTIPYVAYAAVTLAAVAFIFFGADYLVSSVSALASRV